MATETKKKIAVKWTPELDKLADKAVERVVRETNTVVPTDRKAAEAAILALYSALGFPAPKRFVWSGGPDDLLRAVARDMKEGKSAGEYASYYSDGRFSNYWFERYFFAADHLGWDEEAALVAAMRQVGQLVGGWILADEAAYLSDLPTTICVDAENRPHNTTGPAIGYPNGFGVYCVHGILVPDEWVTRPESLTPKMVDDEQNAERRVALLTLYGMGRYVADSKSELVDEVPDDCESYSVQRPSDGRVYPYGLRGAKLWRRVNGNGDVVQAVELKNSTVEVGGRRKTFFIGVSAKAASVEEAVAWSYGFEKAADYYPESES